MASTRPQTAPPASTTRSRRVFDAAQENEDSEAGFFFFGTTHLEFGTAGCRGWSQAAPELSSRRLLNLDHDCRVRFYWPHPVHRLRCLFVCVFTCAPKHLLTASTTVVDPPCTWSRRPFWTPSPLLTHPVFESFFCPAVGSLTHFTQCIRFSWRSRFQDSFWTDFLLRAKDAIDLLF